MEFDNLKIGELKELLNFAKNISGENEAGLGFKTGEKVIVRTYSAGCWFGELEKKSKNEIILKNARRLWRWFAKEGISLSGVAMCGIEHSKSRICMPVLRIYLTAIEIIPMTEIAIKSIEEAPNATQ